MRDELLNGEIFYSLRGAQIIIERWRNHYNTKRPHSALGYRPPAPAGHRAHGPKVNHALTFKLDHSSAAAQYHKHESDLYDIGNDVSRAWIKQILTKTVCSSSKHQTLGALRNEMMQSDPSLINEAGILYKQFWSYNSNVRDLLFNRGAWKRLQYLESETALEVNSILLNNGVATIPLHDSFILKHAH